VRYRPGRWALGVGRWASYDGGVEITHIVFGAPLLASSHLIK